MFPIFCKENVSLLLEPAKLEIRFTLLQPETNPHSCSVKQVAYLTANTPCLYFRYFLSIRCSFSTPISNFLRRRPLCKRNVILCSECARANQWRTGARKKDSKREYVPQRCCLDKYCTCSVCVCGVDKWVGCRVRERTRESERARII